MLVNMSLITVVMTIVKKTPITVIMTIESTHQEPSAAFLESECAQIFSISSGVEEVAGARWEWDGGVCVWGGG